MLMLTTGTLLFWKYRFFVAPVPLESALLPQVFTHPLSADSHRQSHETNYSCPHAFPCWALHLESSTPHTHQAGCIHKSKHCLYLLPNTRSPFHRSNRLFCYRIYVSCSHVHRSNTAAGQKNCFLSIYRNSYCTETNRTRRPVWWPAACIVGCRFGSLAPRFFFPCISRTCRPWQLQQQASQLRSVCIQKTSPPNAHASCACPPSDLAGKHLHNSLFYLNKPGFLPSDVSNYKPGDCRM